MEPNIANQEIILFAGTSFSKKEYCRSGNYQYTGLDPQVVQLERACWAGRLFEMVPELSPAFGGNRGFIWDVHSTNHFVLINYGLQGGPVDHDFSVDPYLFLHGDRSN